MLYHKIAKGYVNSENRSLFQSEMAYIQVHNTVIQDLGNQVVVGKKLDRPKLLMAGKTLQEALYENPNVFWHTRKPAPRTLSKTGLVERIEAAALGYNRFSQVPMLTRIRYTFTSRRVLHEVGIAPIEIRQHAFERMLQRSEGRQDAVRYMLHEAESRIGLLCTMLAPCSALPDRSMAFPMGQGLLLGDIVHTLYGDPAWDLYEKNDIVRGSQTTQQDIGIMRSPLVVDPDKKVVAFLARTYIGPSEMRESQKELHRQLTSIADEYANYLQAVADLCYFPDDEEVMDESLLDATMEKATEIQTKVIDLVAQGRFSRAMGNRGAPIERPSPPMLVTANRDKEQKAREHIAKLMSSEPYDGPAFGA